MSQAKYRYNLLVVDDHPGILETIRLTLGEQVEFTGASSAETAMDLIQTNSYDIVITDYDLKADINGMTIFKEARRRNPFVTACLMTANDAAPIMRDVFHAFGGIFIEKPFCEDSFVKMLEQARRNRVGLLELSPDHDEDSPVMKGFIAETPSVAKLLETIKTSAKMQSLSLHMTGPTGTGKSTLAKLIHTMSGVKGPLVTVNCSGLEELAMSRLFGHTKGSFTGAIKDQDGFIKKADGGTLFLDELHLLSKEVQGKLLHVLEAGNYQRLGDATDRTSNFRLITAASVDVRQLAEVKDFIPDLWYRISGKILSVPALAERKACIPRIVYQQLRTISQETGQSYEIDNAAMDLLVSFSWDGNIRDLSNTIHSMCSDVDSSGKITSSMVREDLFRRAGHFADAPTGLAKGETLERACRSFEISMISKALRSNGNNISIAARTLGVPRTTLRNRINTLGVRL